MKASTEYARLTDTGAPHDLELAAAIRAVRSERASPSEIAALAERLAPQLTAPPVGPSALPRFAVSTKWLVSLVLTFGLSLFATLHFGRPESQVVAPQVPRSVAPQPLAIPVAAPAPLAAAVEPIEKVVVQSPPPRLVRTKSQLPAAVAPQPQAAPPGVHAEAELQLLGRAQRALDSQPNAALALAEEHAAAYPRGLFVQEREMLAIQALLKVQQRRAALARAKEFLSHYPTSPHARHLRPLVGNGE
jgi:hypothetical protein